MGKYKHVFFDLDGTLWNFAGNAKLTLNEIFEHWKLNQYFQDFSDFHAKFEAINHNYWDLYKQNKVEKEHLSVYRFQDTLVANGLDNFDEALKMSKYYVEKNSFQPLLCDGALEILTYLKPRYTLHIISNGFKEAQYAKLEYSKMHTFFTHVILSEDIGFQKPHPNIFEHAFKVTGATAKNAIIIGDDWKADIEGAIGVGMDYIFYSPYGSVPKTSTPAIMIQNLKEISYIL